MKRNIIFTVLLIVLLGTYFISDAFENRIAWQNFDTGINNSQKYNKKMIMDVYTDWCGWCKKMESSTYADDKVSEYIKTKYVAVKLNAESKNKLKYNGDDLTEAELARGLGITGYPCTVFFDENQKPITKIPGYIDAKEFIYILKFINDGAYKTKSYEEYKRGAKL